MISNFSSSHLRSKQGEAQAPGGIAGQSCGAPAQHPTSIQAGWASAASPFNKGTACGKGSNNLFD